MSYIEKGTPLFLKTNVAFFMLGLVTFAILYSTQPLMPTFSREFHVSPVISSLSLSVTTATLSICMLAAATLSESIGRKNMMTICLILSSVLLLITSFSQNFTSLLVLRSIQGVVLSGLPAIAMAYLSEEVSPRSLGFAIGLYISGNTIGGLTGRILTGILSEKFSWQIAFICIGFLSLLCSLVFWRSLPPSQNFHPQKSSSKMLLKSIRNVLSDKGLLCLYGIAFCLMGSFVTLYNYIGYLLIAPPYSLSQTVISFIFVTYLVGTFSSTWMGKLADQYGRKAVLWIGVLCMALGASITLESALLIKILGLCVFTFGFFGSHSIASSWVGRRAITHKAHASSLYLLFYYGGSSVGGSLGGIFWSSYSWSGVIGFILFLLSLCLIFTMILQRIPRISNSTL